MKLIECVPNISEGRNKSIINEIANQVKQVSNVHLLDIDPGFDTNRTVITFVGQPEPVLEAAYLLIKKASELIDMRNHTGEHSRMGSTDVCPLIPVKNISMQECVDISKKLAKKVSEELSIPVFLYENSASNIERVNLANIRKGEYEGMFEKIKKDNWKPDFGKSENNAKNGAIAIGAREFLIAYNINLNTFDKKIATDIALDIREAGRAKRDKNGNIIRDKSGKILKKPGSLKFCKAVGWYIDEYNQAQVSINLTNYKKTSIFKTFEEVRNEARKRGARVTGSEIVGLMPLDSLLDCGKYYLKKQNRSTGIPEKDILNIAIQSLGLSDISTFDINEKIIEYRIDEQQKSFKNFKVEELVDLTSMGTPTPGGGSVSALAGAFAMALSSMVANLSFAKKGLEKHNKLHIEIAEKSQEFKDRLIKLIDLDSNSYDLVLAAIRLPKKTQEDIDYRFKEIEKATIYAAEVPLEILEISVNSFKLIDKLCDIGNPNSITDIGVGLYLLYSTSRGASMNVKINAYNLTDNHKKSFIKKLQKLDKLADEQFIKTKIKIEKILK